MRVKIILAVTGLFLNVFAVASIVGMGLTIISSFPVRMHHPAKRQPMLCLEDIFICNTSKNEDLAFVALKNIQGVLINYRSRQRNRWGEWVEFAEVIGVIWWHKFGEAVRCFVKGYVCLAAFRFEIAGESNILCGCFPGIKEICFDC